MDPLMSIVQGAAFFVLVLTIVGLLSLAFGSDSRRGFGADVCDRSTRGDWV
jgi:hypothetical protein